MKNQKKYPLSIAAILMVAVSIFAQVEVKDGGKVGVIVTGSGNSLNVTQIFGKSPEYAQLTSSIATLTQKQKAKTQQCAEQQKDNLPEKYITACLNELKAIETELDSIQKMEKQFRDDVVRLAETFEKTPINSERLRKAKALFDEGKIREVQFVMNDKEMTAEGDALLLERKRLEKRLERNDSLLQVKATEFRIKAQAKALDFADPLRIDSTAFCYRQALRYADEAQILYDFAKFFKDNHQYDSAFVYYPKLIVHPKTEDWYKAYAYGDLGDLYESTGNLDKAMSAFTKFLEAYESFSKKKPNNNNNKSNLVIAYERLGRINKALGNLDKALAFFEECNRLGKDLHSANPSNVDFILSLAISYRRLGETHTALGNLDKALAFFEECTKLMKDLYTAYPMNVPFKNGLAISYSKLGDTHTALGNLDRALAFFEDEAKLFEELYTAYPTNVSFKNGLAISYSRLGNTYMAIGNLDKALAFFEEQNKLLKDLYTTYPTNVVFKKNLAISYSHFGATHTALGNLDKAMGFLEDYNRLSKELYATYPTNVSFKNGLAISYEKLGSTHTVLGNLDKALMFFEDYNRLETELYIAYPNNVNFKSNYAESQSVLFAINMLSGNNSEIPLLDKAILLFQDLFQKAPINDYKRKIDICKKMQNPKADLKKLILEMSSF